MDCIQTENKGVDMFGAGKHGFQAGNPGAGLLATYVSPAWCNGVQEEILNVVRAGGLVPTGADLTQLLQAIKIMVGLRVGGVGEIKQFYRTDAPPQWLKANGQSIGSAASGATARANADTLALFTHLWGQASNAVLPIQDSTGALSARGASAAADFAANKRMPLPNMCGEFLRGLDDGRGVDPGRTLGSAQAQQQLAHDHPVNDPTHPHAVNDPTHAHPVNDPTHPHPITDPTHVHGNTVERSNESGNTTPFGSGGGADEGPSSWATDPAGTGITVGAAATGVTVGGAATGVTVAAAATGITVGNSSGGAELRVRNVAVLFCISY